MKLHPLSPSAVIPVIVKGIVTTSPALAVTSGRVNTKPSYTPWITLTVNV